MKFIKYNLSVIAVICLIFFGWSLISPTHAFAQFNYTDHPMDDSVMTSSRTMTASQIQTFLSSVGSGIAGFSDVENCGSTAGAHYAYYTNYYSCGQTRSAAQIIYDAAQAYGINPQVILATMQKEQSLVTTPNPTASQINFAMGYGCPDSGGCSYAGFFNQVDNATWQFKTDIELSSGHNYWGYTPSSYPCNGATRYYSTGLLAGNNVVFYNDYGTAYSQFTIPNASTGALYCYTPHVYPGNSQQYYSGSYWFVYYFNQWFVPYSWQVNSQYAYTDQTKTTPIGLNNLSPGQRVYVGIKVQNTGYVTWNNSGPNPVDLGTLRPMGGSSSFFDSTWLGPNRPARMIEPSVAPGQTATFEFWMTAPVNSASQTYNQYFGLVQEGVAWMPDIGLNFNMTVRPATYSYNLTSQYAYTDQTKTTPIGLNNLSPGQRVYVGIKIKNTGNMTWTNSGLHPLNLGTSHSFDRNSSFSNGSDWLSPSRPARMIEPSVAPGQTATFEFWMTAPQSNVGNFLEYFDPLAEGIAWMPDIGLNFSGTLISPRYSWAPTSQYAYTDQTKTTPIGLNNLSPGQRVYVGIKIKNTGNMTWTNSGLHPLNLGTSHSFDRNSSFSNGSDWLSPSRPARMIEPSVAPGQTATFEFWMTAPQSNVGNFLEYFDPLAEGIAWMPDINLNFNITVR
ncbi:MAG: hypothetical protein WCG30_00800 [Candidatus Saccharibacteria bacterium]